MGRFGKNTRMLLYGITVICVLSFLAAFGISTLLAKNFQTPEGMRKMFCIEALVIAGRPLLITLPLTVLSVGFMITASYLNPMEFLVKAPIVPIVMFILAIFGFVSLAYYIGGKRMLNCNLADALRNDSAA